MARRGPGSDRVVDGVRARAALALVVLVVIELLAGASRGRVSRWSPSLVAFAPCCCSRSLPLIAGEVQRSPRQSAPRPVDALRGSRTVGTGTWVVALFPPIAPWSFTQVGRRVPCSSDPSGRHGDRRLGLMVLSAAGWLPGRHEPAAYLTRPGQDGLVGRLRSRVVVLGLGRESFGHDSWGSRARSCSGSGCCSSASRP